MRVYKVKLVSQTNATVLILILLTVFIGSIVLLIPHGIQNQGFSIMVIFGCFTFAWLLWQKFVIGRTEWTITDKEVTIHWTKNFSFANSQDIKIQWAEIENIRKGIDPHYYNLKIELVSGQTIKYYHDSLTNGDDFQDLLKILYKTLGERKLQPTSAL